MAQATSSLSRRSFGETSRTDSWWFQPAIIFAGLLTFVVYSTWAAFQGEHYRWGPYLSPFYSPELFGDPEHAWFGPRPGGWPTAGWCRWRWAMGFRLTGFWGWIGWGG